MQLYKCYNSLIWAKLQIMVLIITDYDFGILALLQKIPKVAINLG